MHIIAHIHTDFKEKFGIPRQSGLVENTHGVIVFEKTYRDPQALRGIEGYSHLWLLWQFSECPENVWHPTVRPPRLGGNRRMGVFATRSPFRPNPIGLSSVRLLGVRESEDGMVLDVAGADLLDGTPIYDIKPYLPFTDAHPDATGGFADPLRGHRLHVCIPDELCACIEKRQLSTLRALLQEDPRPSYQDDPSRIYGMAYADMQISFTVENDTLTVRKITKVNED